MKVHVVFAHDEGAHNIYAVFVRLDHARQAAEKAHKVMYDPVPPAEWRRHPDFEDRIEYTYTEDPRSVGWTFAVETHQVLEEPE